MSEPATIVVYDGECPFCRSFVGLMRLRAAVGAVTLVDAREGGEIARKLVAEGYDLDAGMVVRFGGRIYFGAEAVALLATLTDAPTRLARALASLLRSPRRAALLYPVMTAGRRLVLAALRVPRLRTDPSSLVGIASRSPQPRKDSPS